MQNKLYNYKENNNKDLCTVSTETFLQDTNEIIGSITPDGFARSRFLYTVEEAAKFPSNPQHFDQFTFDGRFFIYVHFKTGNNYNNYNNVTGGWCALGSPWNPVRPVVTPFQTWAYYNGGQFIFAVISTNVAYDTDILKDFNGPLINLLPHRCHTLKYFIQEERKLNPRVGVTNYQTLLDPIIIPIEQYNQDRLLGTITSSNITTNGINFPQDIANKLSNNEQIWLIPTEQNDTNLLGKTVTIPPTIKIVDYNSNPIKYSTTFAPVYQNYQASGFNNVGLNIVVDNVFTNISGDLIRCAQGWPQYNYDRNASHPRGLYYTGMLRQSLSNTWNFSKFAFKQIFQVIRYFRRSTTETPQQSTADYPLPFYDNPIAKTASEVVDSGSGITFNVYKALPYKVEPDGTEIILSPSRSKFQAQNLQKAGDNFYDQYVGVYSTTYMGGTFDYFNMVWLNETNVNLNENSVQGQTNEFGTLPQGTEIQVFPAHQYPNSSVLKCHAIFLEPLTTQQMVGYVNSFKELGIGLKSGDYVFLLGQSDPLKNGLYTVYEGTWNKQQYLPTNFYNSVSAGTPPVLSSHWASRGETIDWFVMNLYIFGVTKNDITKTRLFKIPPPWSLSPNYSSPFYNAHYGFTSYTELTPSENQKFIMDTWKFAGSYGAHIGFPLFSFLPKGLESAKSYYLIKNQTTIKFAATYQDALDGIGVPLETIGEGAMTIYTAPANENKNLMRDDQGVVSILDPTKIYFLINSKNGIQLADSKQNAIAKIPIKLVVPPNTYINLIKYNHTPKLAPLAWDPTKQNTFEPFNITGKNTNNSSVLVSGYNLFSRLAGSYWFTPSESDTTESRSLIIPAGTLTGVLTAENYDTKFVNDTISFAYFPIPITRINPHIYSGNYQPINVDASWSSASPPPATFTLNGVTVNQVVDLPDRTVQGNFLTKTFKNRLSGDNALAQMITNKLNEFILGSDISLEPQRRNMSTYYYTSGNYINNIYSQTITYSLKMVPSGTWYLAYTFGNPFATPSEVRYYTSPPQGQVGDYVISVTLNISYNSSTQIMDIVTYGSVGTIGSSLKYKKIGNQFILQNGNLFPSAVGSFSLQLGSPMIPVNKSIKLTFSNDAKHIWRKVTLSTEKSCTFTEWQFWTNQNTRIKPISINDQIEGVDYEVTSSSFNGVVILNYNISKNCWESGPLNSNGLKFKIEISCKEVGQLYYASELTWEFRFKIRGSPNTFIELGYLISDETKTTTVNDLTISKRIRKGTLGSIPANGFQLTILDPLYKLPIQNSSYNYLGHNITPIYNWGQQLSMDTSVLYSGDTVFSLYDWGKITYIGTAIGTLTFKDIPIIQIIYGPSGFTANGTGAILEPGYLKSYNYTTLMYEYRVTNINIVNAGSNYFPKTSLRQGDYIRMTATNLDGSMYSKDLFFSINNAVDGTAFPSTPNPTLTQLAAAFGKPWPNIYPARVVGKDGKTYVANQAQGPVTINLLEKIELIDP